MGQLQTKKIYVHQLEPGMYVSGLDRPWLETPFYLQGFMIRNAGEESWPQDSGQSDKWINAPFFGIVDAVEGAKNDQKTSP